ncbi:MAG: C39 family peptidase [Chloroflexota bacterium]
MTKFIWRLLILAALLLLPSMGVFAQDAPAELPESELPASYTLSGFSYEPQRWNNCGPATLTIALSYFGYSDNQVRAQEFLKPNIEDKNVSPWQMTEFVNTQVPEIPVYATQRYGGDLDTIRTLLANDFPLIIEAGYDPPNLGAGWMGHYLLMIGYNDNNQTFTTHDSYEGANTIYSYDHIEEFWQHFSYTYIVLYEAQREAELMTLLGDHADEQTNNILAINRAVSEAEADMTDAHAWFNIGTGYVNLARLAREAGDEATALQHYTAAATAFDQARNTGNLPWRMLWYQFGPYEAYYEIAQAADDPAVAQFRYNEILQLANQTIQSCQNPDGVCYVEETYYYAGLARAALGDTDRALANLGTALAVNSNFTPAIQLRDELVASASND